jgi:hypothetical protein
VIGGAAALPQPAGLRHVADERLREIVGRDPEPLAGGRLAVGLALVCSGRPDGFWCALDRGICPVTPLRETPAVKRGDHKPPSCEHGTWTFAAADSKRRAAKWRCPTGECKPASTWVKADRLHPLIPRES